MSDRSEEVTDTREPRSTEDVLEETDRLLSGDVGRTEPSADDAEASASEESGSWWRSSSSESATAETDTERSLSRYFSPRAFLALFGVVTAGLLAGSFLLPFGGRLVGMFLVTFLVGLLTTRRRYLETALAGSSVGVASSLLANPVLAVAGSTTAVVGIGLGTGLLACVIGYYFGRDLRDGLSREV